MDNWGPNEDSVMNEWMNAENSIMEKGWRWRGGGGCRNSLKMKECVQRGGFLLSGLQPHASHKDDSYWACLEKGKRKAGAVWIIEEESVKSDKKIKKNN